MESGIYEGNMTERVIPSENVQLMFHYKNPFLVYHTGNITKKQPRSIISGLSNSWSDVSTNGETGVVFISFYPAGACHFFDFPLSAIENQSIDMADIYSREINKVEEILSEKRTIPEKVSVIDDFLLKRFSPVTSYNYLLIHKAYDIIKHRKGQITVANLTENLSITTKSLERKFSQYIGKTTKQVIKLVRFQEILKDFSNTKEINLTDCAYRNGYFDQTHFIKDFKSYSGYTPKEFLLKYPGYNINADHC